MRRMQKMEEQVEEDFEPCLKGPPLPVTDRYYCKHFALGLYSEKYIFINDIVIAYFIRC